MLYTYQGCAIMRFATVFASILVSGLLGCVQEEPRANQNPRGNAATYDTASDEGPRGPVGPITPIANTGGRGIAKYIGTTSSVFAGNAGFSTFNTACETEFPNTRVCVDMEIFSTIPAPIPGADAWMITSPHLVDQTSWYNPLGQSGSQPNCIDGPQRLFRGSSGVTLYIDSIGETRQGLCTDQRAVACCGY